MCNGRSAQQESEAALSIFYNISKSVSEKGLISYRDCAIPDSMFTRKRMVPYDPYVRHSSNQSSTLPDTGSFFLKLCAHQSPYTGRTHRLFPSPQAATVRPRFEPTATPPSRVTSRGCYRYPCLSYVVPHTTHERSVNVAGRIGNRVNPAEPAVSACIHLISIGSATMRCIFLVDIRDYVCVHARQL